MKTVTRLSVCLSMVVAISPALLAQQATTTKEAATAIAKVRTSYAAAANAHDWSALAKLFAPDAELMPPDAPAVKGRSAIEAFLTKQGTEAVQSNVKIASNGTTVAGDWAIDTGTFTQTVTPKGAAAINDKGKYVVVLKKDASGAWLMEQLIYNSDMPMAMPQAK